jgi:uncharacterized membrane protein YoaK (UPF0700 family)
MTDEQRRSIGIGLLSFTAGTMDAIAFLALGDVFTSAMTGNTILLGLAVGQGRVSAALHSLAAFLFYACGVALAALPLRRPARGIEQTVLLEALVLAGFAGVWTVRGGPVGPFEVYLLIILSALGMGLQGAVGRTIQIPGIPTIVITSTMTALIGTLAERALSRDRRVVTPATWQQLVSFLVYLASAIGAGFAVSSWLALLPFVPLAGIVILATGLQLRLLRM